MSNTVTIKGRRSTTVLKAGEVVTVERTDRVDALIAGGWATVVDSTQTPNSLTGVVTPPEPDAGPAEVEPGGEATPQEPAVPARSASKADWTEFLTEQGIEFDDEDSRDDLVARWHG